MSSLPPLTRRSLLTGGVGAATFALTDRAGSASARATGPETTPTLDAPATASTPPTVEVEDLGAPLSTVLIHEGAFGPGPDGQLLGYAVLQGDNAPLNVIDASTGGHLETLTLPGASGAWGITVTDDGDLYLGTYYTGHLYHYSPTTGTVTDLGQPVPGDEWLWGLTHDAQGRIYGGAYADGSGAWTRLLRLTIQA